MFNLAEFLKALSDETRLRIMSLINHRALCVCEICEITGESQPKISRHLARLRAADFVRDERRSQWVFYSINLENKMASEIMSVIEKNIEESPILKSDLERMLAKVKDNSMCEGKNIVVIK